MSPSGAIGVGLSVLALFVTLGVAADAVRRKELRVAGRSLRGPAAIVARAGLVVLTIAALAAGVFGAPLLSATRPWTAADRRGGVTATATERTVRLPFYIHTVVERRDARGTVLGGATRRVLQVPWILLLWLGLYWLAVVRSAPSPVGGRGDGSERAPPSDGPPSPPG